jgi:hypothetical protein
VANVQDGNLDLDEVAVALAKMDWNNDTLYGQVPATMMYSQRLSGPILNVRRRPGSAHPYRLFM